MQQNAPEVLIRGAGVFGLAIAFVCARRGAAVRVVDPGGVGAGSSGGFVGALAPHVPENWNAKKAFQFDSLIGAAAFWADVGGVSGLSAGYARLGRLQPLADARARDIALARAEEARDLWQGLAVWEVVPADAGSDWAPRAPSGWLVRDSLTARLHPRRACEALARAVVRLGGEIVANDARDAPCIWATGAPGLDALTEAVGRTMGTGVKGQAALLALDRHGAPQIFADGLHVVPHEDGTTGIGSTSERDFTDGAATDAALDDVIARARAAVPALADARVLSRWAGVRPRARTRAPMLGPHPTRPGDYVANGGFKIGFGMAPKVAEVMADLVLEGHDAIPDGFRVADNL